MNESQRDELLTRLDEKTTYLKEKVEENHQEITSQITQVRFDINGTKARVSSLENWRSYLAGAIAIIGIGFSIYLKIFVK